MRQQIIFLVLCLGTFLPSISQTKDDPIVISDATCQFWPVTDDNGAIKFKNKTQTTYLAERMGGWVYPAVYYGNNISLDSHSAGLGNMAAYKNIEPPGVFYDDIRVCYYSLHLPRKGKKASARFECTFNDNRYMDCIFLDDDYLIRHKQVEITLPKGYQLAERNMNNNIRKSQYVSKQGDTIVCYTLTNQPAPKRESLMPSALKTRPCVLLTGAFKDVHELYEWSREQSDVDCRIAGIDSLIAAINPDASTKEECMRRTFAWVQTNIRYVAYEAGKASHQPDRPSEVLRKRYGDCKGMSLLLKTLLQAQDIDARLTFVGTDDIPFGPSEVPALIALNHVICTVFLDSATYFLDPTTRYLAAGSIPGYLQGREAIVENGADCTVMRLPTLPPAASTDSLHYEATLDDQQLNIQATASWSGTIKELTLHRYHSEDSKNKDELAARMLNADDRHRQVTQATWTSDSCSAEWAVLQGLLTDTKAVLHSGEETYVELDPHNDILATPIDTTGRTLDVELPFRCKTVREVRLQLPEGSSVSWLPQGISIPLPQGELSCTFEKHDDSILFRKVMTISQPVIRHADISAWNDALHRWHHACNEQIILKR